MQNSFLWKRPISDKETAASSDTFFVHDEPHAEGALSPPIYQTSLFTFKSYEEMAARFKGQSDRASTPVSTIQRSRLCCRSFVFSKAVTKPLPSPAESPPFC